MCVSLAITHGFDQLAAPCGCAGPPITVEYSYCGQKRQHAVFGCWTDFMVLVMGLDEKVPKPRALIVGAR